MQKRIRHVLVTELLKQIGEEASGRAIGDAELQKEYAAYKTELGVETSKNRVGQVITSTRKEADDVYRSLQLASQPRSELARLVQQHCVDPLNRSRNGDVGFVYPGMRFLPKNVTDSALRLEKIGEVAAPIEANGRWHTLVVTGKHGGGATSFDQVKPLLERRIRARRVAGARDELARRLRKDADVRVNEDVLERVLR